MYIGAKTGRDGIHGATMASAEFDASTEEKRPTVQVGDPFIEKLLLEACLELWQTDAIVGIQDMGAAGLTSSSVEMASKGGDGLDLDIDRVPLREEGMTAYEMLLSETQERMLMVLRPGHEAEAARDLQEMGARFRRLRPDHRHPPHGRPPSWRHRRRSADRSAGQGVAGIRPAARADAATAGAGQRRTSRNHGTARRSAPPARLARSVLEAMGLGTVRPYGDGLDGAASGGRRRGRPHPGDEEGHRRHRRTARPATASPIRAWAAVRRWPRPGAT